MSFGNAFRSSQVSWSIVFDSTSISDKLLGREIPEEFAQKVDHTNEFPTEMWGKLGKAG